jgi:hypothetical protein
VSTTEQEHMFVALPPEGGEKPTANPDTLPESLEDLSEQEERELIELVRRASNQEDLDRLMEEYERYLHGHQN